MSAERVRVERVPGSEKRTYLFGSIPLPFPVFEWEAYLPGARHLSVSAGKHRLERNARKAALEALKVRGGK